VPVDVPNVAFLTPEGKKVLIVLNETSNSKTIKIKMNKKEMVTSLPANAVGTLVW
jgi:glucosylceramidase